SERCTAAPSVRSSVTHCVAVCLNLASFPTRRSSDLISSPADQRSAHNQHRRTESRIHPRHSQQLQSEQSLSLGLWLALARRQRRSEEHTSELQSRENPVCRLPLGKKTSRTRASFSVS